MSEPLEAGEVSSLTDAAEGIVRAGKTVFVPGALPGESIEFRRRHSRRQHDHAELVRVVAASPDRVPPRCAHFGVCGGCALQHLAPPAQLVAKQAELGEALARIGRVAPARWLAPLEGPHWGYRRRARLGVKYVRKKARVLVGFRERAKPYVAELSRCEVLAPPLDSLLMPLAELIGALSIRERLPQIEAAVADSTTALVLRVLDPPTDADLGQLLAFEAAHPVRFYLQPGGPDTVTPLRAPAPILDYALVPWQLRLRFEPTDFIQINATINERLIQQALELLAVDDKSEVLDLYCGLGNFTLPMARAAGSVVGVEGDAGLVARARDNAAHNGVGNATFHSGNLAAPDPAVDRWLSGQYSHVLLDPPRVGAAEMLPHLARLGAGRIVYVSCHPGSLARDVGVLVHEYGYTLAAAGAVDMFPHTMHVESIALLKRA